MSTKHLALFAAASLAASGLYGCKSVETTAAKTLISSDEEAQLGQQVQQQLQQQGTKFITDPEVTGYVTEVANKILGRAKKERPDVKWTIQVIDDPKTVNAFAVPGGHLYVYSGLLMAIENEAELAGVMGHESGHVALRHSARQMVDQFGLETAIGMALGKNPNQVAAVAASLAGQGTMLHFSRTDETEADEFGAQAMSDANYDPKELAHFFEKLQQQEGKVPGVMKYLSDHPLTADRITHIHDYIQQHNLHGSVVNPQTVPPIQQKLKSGVSSSTGNGATPAKPAPTTTTPGTPTPNQPTTPPAQQNPSGTGTYHPPPPPPKK